MQAMAQLSVVVMMFAFTIIVIQIKIAIAIFRMDIIMGFLLVNLHIL